MTDIYRYQLRKVRKNIQSLLSETIYEELAKTLSSGIPPQVVMKWTGHSDYQAMKPYIDIAEKTKVDAMKLLDEALKQ